MALTGTVKAFNPHKGWGFVECNGTDMFMHKKELNGFCPSKGDQVQFTVGQTEKGPVAENVRVVGAPEEASYFGQIKSLSIRASKLQCLETTCSIILYSALKTNL